MTDRRVTLPEELLLLMLDEEKGTFRGSSIGLSYGLAGAAILELVQAKLVRIEDDKVIPATGGSTRDEWLLPMIEKIRESSRTRSLKHWVGHFGRASRRLKEPLLERLVDRGILKEEEGRVLWVFPVKRYPESNATTEREIRDRARSAIQRVEPSDPRTLSLVGLIHACDLVAPLFEKDERKEAKRRAKEIAEREPVGTAVEQVITAVQAAVIAAATAAGAASS